MDTRVNSDASWWVRFCTSDPIGEREMISEFCLTFSNIQRMKI
jgi:hypothetical protein